MRFLGSLCLALLLFIPREALAVDLTVDGTTITLGGQHNYGNVVLKNNATIIVPPFAAGDYVNTGNLVLHADSISIEAGSRIIAKGAGYQGVLCTPGPGPAGSPLAGGRGGCELQDSGGGGAHFGNGGRGTKDNPVTYPSGFEESCQGDVNATNDGCANVIACRDGDGLPTVAGQSYFHSIWATEFGAAGGDKGCADGDGFVDGGYGPKPLAAGNGGGRIVLAAVNPAQTGTLSLSGLIRADGNRGCGHGNDSAGGGAGGSILIVGDNVTITASAVVSAKGGRGGDEQPKCLKCAIDGDCGTGQTCVNNRCAPCNCKPCSINGDCDASLGQTCKSLTGFGNVCADASNTCTPLDSTDDESECTGNQNSGTCDDCGGGGGGGIINVMSRVRTIDVGATFNVAGAVGGICPICTGEAGGGAGELLIDGAYVGEVCDGYDNDFDGVPDNGLMTSVSCGIGPCAASVSACSTGSPQICAPTVSGPSCEGSRGTSRPRIALLLDSSASMLQDLAGTPTFGDGSADFAGIDTSGDGKSNDSKLFLAKDAVSQLIAAYPEIDFLLARYHQDEGVQRSCQTAKWIDCQGVCCSYDDPNKTISTSPLSCKLTLPKQGGGFLPTLNVYEDSLPKDRCINYAGTCGEPRRGADILVGFESDVRQYLKWLDGGEVSFNGSAIPGNYCNGLSNDCELRGSGPTPIAESLRAIYDYVTPIKAEDPAIACRDYSVIFVSDGGEECGGDPVTAANELWGAGIKTYVIGVSVDANQGATLNAIAAAGHTGSFIPVTSASQLLPALVSIVSSSIRTELCNGIDDNCNGQIDEGYNLGAACDNGLKGVCRGTGHIACDPADLTQTKTHCVLDMPGGTATAETCNGLDDDCNGLTDENNPGGGGTCGSSTAPCVPGHLQCQGGTLVCVGASGGNPESCNGVDDDCNGVTDDCGGVVGGCNGGACGSSVGECRPGTWMCAGAGGYQCIGGTGPTTETCNGKDDDCDGAIDDNVPGTGGPCDTDTGGNPLCHPGTVRCIGGQIVCQGGVPFHPPSCTCTPDDCSQPVDGGTGSDGCPAGSACLDCACRTPCAGGEFPCSGDLVCRDGFCVPPTCGGVLCKSWEDCIGDQCVDRCKSITCTGDQVCNMGTCVENDCYGLGCPTGQLCESGVCVLDPCAGVSCPADQFCRDGMCVGSCGNVSCPADQMCVDGACVDDPCGMGCPPGKVCENALCVNDPCFEVVCGTGRTCDNGNCVDDPCNGIKCPGDPSQVTCKDGQCVPVNPLAVGPSEKIAATGGGGFACAIAGVGSKAEAPPWLVLFGLALLCVSRLRRSVR